MVQTRLHDRYGNVSTVTHARSSIASHLLPQGAVEDCPTLATVAGGADVTPYEDEDEPETDEDEDDVDDSDPLSFGRGSLLRYWTGRGGSLIRYWK